MSDHSLTAPSHTHRGLSASHVEEAPAPTRSRFSAAFTFRELSFCFAFFFPVLYVVLAVIEASSYLWRPIAVLLYTGLFLFALMMALGGLAHASREASPDRVEFYIAYTVTAVIAVIVCFSQGSKHLAILFGGFSAAGTGYWHWMRFGCANLLEAVLFDIPDIYDWRISEIRPMALWSQSILFVFRTSLEFMVVAAVLHQAGVARKLWNIPPSEEIRSKSYAGHLIRSTGNLLLIALWSIPLLAGVAAVQNDGFSIEISLAFARLSLPVAFGAWLTWKSLTALRIPGKWNKTFSLAGIGLGVRLIYTNWEVWSAFFGGS